MEPSNFAVQLCDQIDGIICYLILSLVFLYTSAIYIRETCFIRRGYTTLRTFILFFTVINCSLLCLYTLLARLYDDQWSELAEDVGDLMIATVSFCQFYFVLVWFSRILKSVDDEFSQQDVRPWYQVPIHLLFLILISAYLITGAVLLSMDSLDTFKSFQNIILFTACLVFFFAGTYFILNVHSHTNVLDISAESYSVIRRSKTTVYILGTCAVFAILLAALSLFMNDDDSIYGNAIETKYYSCHKLPCLVNFLIRVIFLVTLPNWSIAYTFSSPAERNLHLIPITRTSFKYPGYQALPQ